MENNNTYIDGDYFYLVESLMGTTLKQIYNIYDKIFDYYTILNIIINITKIIKILHDLDIFIEI